MYLVLKRMHEDVDREVTMKDKLEKVADHIVQLYNDVVAKPPAPGEPDIGYPNMILSGWRSDVVGNHSNRFGRSTVWELVNVWHIQNDSSLHMFGIGREGCK